VLESESCRARKEEDALVDERRVHRIELVNVSTGLKHMCNGRELELKKSAGFDLLARPVLAGGEDAVEAIGKKIHAPRRVLMTLNHCATPPFTNSGHATRRTQPNTTASDPGMTRFAMGLWESCADAVDLADHMSGERKVKTMTWLKANRERWWLFEGR
jgi:hypothetical protein